VEVVGAVNSNFLATLTPMSQVFLIPAAQHLDICFAVTTAPYHGPVGARRQQKHQPLKLNTSPRYSGYCRELELESNQPVTIFCDNKAAIQLANHPAYHPRTKHIRVAYHIICDYIEEKEIKMMSIDTKEQLADIITKPLSHVDNKRFRELITVHPIE
jgi:hypothetical protein